MDNPELDRALHALTLATGALVAVVGSGRVNETDKITFTGAFAGYGQLTIKDILDIADAALGTATTPPTKRVRQFARVHGDSK